MATSVTEAKARSRDFADISRRIEEFLANPLAVDPSWLIHNLRFDWKGLMADTASRVEEIRASALELKDLEEQIKNF